jgi:hypothetical protein
MARRVIFAASAVTVGVLFSAGSASAATYKVGPTQQYKQLSDVASQLKPGDVVEVDGDATYTGGVVFDQPGDASNKITIKGVPVNGKRPVVSGATNTIEAQADHYVFQGLEITGGSFRCFYHHADDITLSDSVIHDCPQHGLLGADADSGSLLLEYTEVYKCGEGTQHHQIYMATDETAHPKSVFRMQHCYVHDANGGNNVKSRAERNEIHYNWIEGAMYHELELIGPDGQDPTLAREDSDVVGNVLIKRASSYVVRFGGDGTGETNGRYRFVNNSVVVQPGGSAVFRLFDGIESVEMHNNVFTVDGSGDVNLVRTTEAVWSTGSALIAGSNNWVITGSSNAPTEWTGTVTGADPGFAAYASYDLTPTASSPLVDAGASSTSGPPGHDFPSPLAAPTSEPPKHQLEALGAAKARASVGTIDIGAYEYGTPSGGSGGSGGGASGGTAGNATGGSATGGTGGTAPGTGGAKASGSGDDGGCGCRANSSGCGGGLGLLSLLALGALYRRARRRS